MRRERGRKKRRRIFYVLAVVLYCFSTTALAAEDPLAVVNNLSDFIFGLVRAIGMILIGYGIVQIGLSLKSHDPSQRANGIMTVAGGIVVTFAKEILNTIAG
ncbi:TrbC/VirB2 family protein [Eubacterium callanderi]|uniref:TrbC/VirB2 family protein n=1 Tax=Eubacterium callanderi TaxID=53442 RepID=UPI003994F7AA